MSTYEAISLMISSGMFIVSLISLFVVLIGIAIKGKK